MPAETVVLEGHVIDSLTLAKVLDLVLAGGAEYEITSMEVGRTNVDPSRAVLRIITPDETTLEGILREILELGANVLDAEDVTLLPCPADGVLPDDFYSTTNLATRIRLGGRWVDVNRAEMDCAITVRTTDVTAVTTPMHAVLAGDLVVVGRHGVAVDAPAKPRDRSSFEFMASDASSEKPKRLIVEHVASRMRAARSIEPTGRILAVCGPAVIHTGAGPALARLVAQGWIDILFAGNGFATHDIESNVLGTSLGVSLARGSSIEGGHSNHLRIINSVRRHGSIAASVGAGFVNAGVMFECVRHSVPFVLAGSVRDDGPLPDVITDVVEAADAMRSHLDGVRVALMFASTLHSIATGNLLPASVEVFCVDISQAVVTKLADRGSHQVLGVVTDVGLFISDLDRMLCGNDVPIRNTLRDPSSDTWPR